MSMKDVEAYIRNILETRKVHFTLIDPDEQTPEEALEIATEAIEGGTDGIMIGGSTVNNEDVENTCIRKHCSSYYHISRKHKQRKQIC